MPCQHFCQISKHISSFGIVIFFAKIQKKKQVRNSSVIHPDLGGFRAIFYRSLKFQMIL